MRCSDSRRTISRPFDPVNPHTHRMSGRDEIQRASAECSSSAPRSVLMRASVKLQPSTLLQENPERIGAQCGPEGKAEQINDAQQEDQHPGPGSAADEPYAPHHGWQSDGGENESSRDPSSGAGYPRRQRWQYHGSNGHSEQHEGRNEEKHRTVSDVQIADQVDTSREIHERCGFRVRIILQYGRLARKMRQLREL